MSLGRIWAIASNGFREVIRDRILYLIGLFALLMVAAWRILPEVAAGTEDKMLLDFGLAFATALGVVVATFVGTGLVNKEIDKRTILLLVTKPVSRAELIIGKHLGLSGVLAVLVTAMTVIYLIILTLGKVSYPMSSLVISQAYLFLELSLLTAVALLFGVFTSSLLAVFLTFAVYLVGHLSQDMIKFAGITRNPGFQQFAEKLYLVVPDLSRLDLKNNAVYGILPPPESLLTNAVYGLIYTILLLTIAILIFSRREF
ncbi:ABC-2 type transporter [Crinalium epipsammum PCC 9333]|uniref:ABC-2 type transporter n=1 Tax=Crinalium epipsammum PCC 9333 TaxID=1173022 RepID=K9VYT1_9CYAN|nr:ABC transporter permease [Crinalium epipsammum]AFZ13106.1 ABC-2 type transporter [Crinalium epipsammum PCC 9333]